MAKYIPRLYCLDDLKETVTIDLAEQQAHYLRSVMRLKVENSVLVFNGRDGEWLAHIVVIDRKHCKLLLIKQTRPQMKGADIWLLFGPIKHGRIEYLIEKATELGVRRLYPVITDHTQVSRIKLDRLHAHAVEAAEQSERLDVPQVKQPIKLGDLLKTWNPERLIFMGDERCNAPSMHYVCQQNPSKSAAVLIGPEGGFSDQEFKHLKALSFVQPVSLGPRILRADTAALAMLSCWQSFCGDW
ncbi:MAG: 16S rRNA (uracil(1498)-N(3))-methyltransferase [Alphaproteobacteria bacterium]|nr:16S rRNA (uracil(1498)-N(3))-methyltransferase [Alphaproteobacteria bacterium]